MIQTSPATRRSAFFPAIQGDLPTVVRGEGIYLYDDTGRRFIDAAGGVGCVTAIGHGVAEIADAVAQVTPGDLNEVVLFNGGSEATEAAVKLARQYWLAREHPEKFLV